MTNAAAIATLVEIAGEDRVAVTVGSGFTGRMAMGQRALRWSFVEDYVNALRGLLQGRKVEWEGKPIKMLHADGFGAARPIDVPILIAAAGPRGIAVAKAVGDGVFGGGAPIGDDTFDWRPALIMGTVLEEGKIPGRSVRSRRRVTPRPSDCTMRWNTACRTACPGVRSGWLRTTRCPHPNATWRCTTGTW